MDEREFYESEAQDIPPIKVTDVPMTHVVVISLFACLVFLSGMMFMYFILVHNGHGAPYRGSYNLFEYFFRAITVYGIIPVTSFIKHVVTDHFFCLLLFLILWGQRAYNLFMSGFNYLREEHPRLFFITSSVLIILVLMCLFTVVPHYLGSSYGNRLCPYGQTWSHHGCTTARMF